MVKITAISDLHGQLPQLEPFDLLLIAGDECPINDHSYNRQHDWIFCEFLDWVNSLPYKDEFSRVVFTPGNHSIWFERNKPTSELARIFKLKTNNRFIYLRNELYNFEYLTNEGLKTISIFGTPWCHKFGNWAFMKDDDGLRAKFAEIPENVDILLSHDCPYGCSDICYKGRSAGKHIGSHPLREAILEKHPKLVLTGHLHSTCKHYQQLCHSMVRNVSLLDERYEMVYEPFVIKDWDEEMDFLKYCLKDEEYDDEYIFPNRDGLLVRLEKQYENTYQLMGDFWKYHWRISKTEDGDIFMIDPSGGPCLCTGSKWFDFTINRIYTGLDLDEQTELILFDLIFIGNDSGTIN